MESIRKYAFVAVRAVFVALVVSSCCGCMMLQGSRKSYLAEWAGDPPTVESAPTHQAIRVGPFSAAEPYASTRMLVLDGKTGRLHGTKGAQLATPPAVFVQAAVVRTLEKSGAFEAVADSALSLGGGSSLRGHVEKARLEKRADGTAVYALRVSFVCLDRSATSPRFTIAEATVPARSSSPEDQARAASEAAGEVAGQLLSALVR